LPGVGQAISRKAFRQLGLESLDLRSQFGSRGNRSF
jgi:hypothetical protein